MFTVYPKFKLVFFDRSIIRTNWRAINDRPLRRAGALVKKIARQSIRRDTRRRVMKSGKRGKYGKPSPPGRPPYSRAPGHPFKLIFNVPGPMRLSEIVGMVGFEFTSNPIPGIHEHGGHVRRLVFIRHSTWGFLSKRRGGRRVSQTVRYPKRPFMIPALRRAKARLPAFWRNSVR